MQEGKNFIWRKIFLKSLENLAQLLVQRKVGDIVPRRFCFIDEHEPIAGVFVEERGGGVHRQRRSGDNQQIRAANRVERAADGQVIQSLFIELDVGFDPPAALGASGHVAERQQLLHRIPCAALLAGIAMDASVQLINVLASRHLVQAVDVLRDNGEQFALFFPLRQIRWTILGFAFG